MMFCILVYSVMFCVFCSVLFILQCSSDLCACVHESDTDKLSDVISVLKYEHIYLYNITLAYYIIESQSCNMTIFFFFFIFTKRSLFCILRNLLYGIKHDIQTRICSLGYAKLRSRIEIVYSMSVVMPSNAAIAGKSILSLFS